jgi:uncharacterized pyridoxal phosphate-containing UPF0001 family protein
MDLIGCNLQAVKQRIANAALACGRNPADIDLIAVSKTFGAPIVAAAHAHGQYAFGENYVQEALEKIAVLADLALNIPPLESRIAPADHEDESTTSDARGDSAGVASPGGPLLRPLEWHFIGPIQSNKTRAIAENFTWVHSVDRPKIAERLSAARPTELPLLQVCIQVNIGNENSKSGIAPDRALELARVVVALPRLRLRGLMAIPPASEDPAQQRRHFAQLRQLKDELAGAGVTLDTLSMGMSGDLEAAIMEGATLLRVGTAIFGERGRH